ncbi:MULTISPECIES: hypothetical protein [Microbacterium]|uniref:hypothetical protein n=1 Tax=Microbacterium TaxID=33882 RepID=UPI0011832667|nr:MULTISPECIES: hypothetical protein [Microbacterium]
MDYPRRTQRDDVVRLGDEAEVDPATVAVEGRQQPNLRQRRDAHVESDSHPRSHGAVATRIFQVDADEDPVSARRVP